MSILRKLAKLLTKQSSFVMDSNGVEPKVPEVYSWREDNRGHVYVNNKNRQILYRIIKFDVKFYEVECLNGVPKTVGTFLDLENAKKWAEKRWADDMDTWIS